MIVHATHASPQSPTSLLSEQEVADWLAVDRKVIRRLARHGILAHHDISGIRRFSRAHVESFLNSTLKSCPNHHAQATGSPSAPTALSGMSLPTTLSAARPSFAQHGRPMRLRLKGSSQASSSTGAGRKAFCRRRKPQAL
ncbi:helix-turn-helix domain-containing protein [Parvibaculum sedimenti]|uniref:Helix-turn-helix domain-containing protein n=1 Tax=Parvibaculum sedimenti TaxID=2608632 RepID=A0A6N6VJF7_9HYPH|nr:helix-turn-helix domain-containing protein [Parvibaculum sedimenti]